MIKLTKEEKKKKQYKSNKICIRNNPEKYNSKYWAEAKKKTYKNNPKKYNKKYFDNLHKNFKNKILKINSKYFNEISKKCMIKNSEKYNSKYWAEATKKTQKNNPEKYNKEYFTQCAKNTIKNNSQKYGKGTPYWIIRCLRSLLYHNLKKYTVKGKITSSKLYGIDWSKVVKYLIETLPKDFEEWNKNNPNNVWSIDYIIAISKFDLNNPEEIKKAFAPENHQWLKLKDNMSKGNRINYIHSQSKLEGIKNVG